MALRHWRSPDVATYGVRGAEVCRSLPRRAFPHSTHRQPRRKEKSNAAPHILETEHTWGLWPSLDSVFGASRFSAETAAARWSVFYASRSRFAPELLPAFGRPKRARNDAVTAAGLATPTQTLHRGTWVGVERPGLRVALQSGTILFFYIFFQFTGSWPVTLPLLQVCLIQKTPLARVATRVRPLVLMPLTGGAGSGRGRCSYPRSWLLEPFFEQPHGTR